MASAYKRLMRRAFVFRTIAIEFLNGPYHYVVTVPAWRERERLETEALELVHRALDRGKPSCDFRTGPWHYFASVAGCAVRRIGGRGVIYGLPDPDHSPVTDGERRAVIEFALIRAQTPRAGHARCQALGRARGA